MFAYIIRRLGYAIPILIGINLLTFYLFFVVNSPDDMARMHLGMKRVTPEAVESWKASHGYDKPLLLNAEADNIHKLTDTIFFEKSLKLFVFDFGSSDDGRDISFDISAFVDHWPAGEYYLCPADGVLQGDLCGFLRRYSVCGADVDLGHVLHYWRAISIGKSLSPDADIGF